MRVMLARVLIGMNHLPGQSESFFSEELDPGSSCETDGLRNYFK